MAFTPDFTTAQLAGTLTSFTITDTSTGDESAITDRFIYLRKYDGTYLVPNGTTTDFIEWPMADDTLTIEDILDKDYCLDITVVFLSGSTIADTKIILTLFTGYGDVFLRKLTQAVAANRELINRANYWVNKNKVRVLYDDAAQGTSFLNDQTIATFCLDEAKKLTDKIQTFF